MAEHDTFITSCESKTHQILKQRMESQRKLSSSSNASRLPTPFPNLMKPSSPFERTVTKKNKMRLPNAAPSLISRRTIERDFYKMKNASTKKLKYPAKEAPPLKSSVLRKMYRCDEKTMVDKQKRASRMQAKFEHLQQTHQDADDAANSSDSSSDDDQNSSSHVIHDLVERLVENENRTSLQRAQQLAASSIYTPSVKQMWDELVHTTEEGEAEKKSGDTDGDAVDDDDDEEEEGVTHCEEELARTNIAMPAEEDTTNILALKSTSGCAINTSKICPGRKPLGQSSGIWRLNAPMDEIQSESTLFHWPSPAEIKYPDHLDTSQASTYFYSKPIGRDGETCVTALNSLAFKSPILAPLCYAPSQGFMVPPFSQHECVSGSIPHITFPGTSLMKTKVDSRLDILLRQPIVVVDPAASRKDHTHASRSPNSLDEFDEHGFRRMTFADTIEYDEQISTRSFGISSALPNKPKVSPPITHTSHECCVEYLSRERTVDDYHYIAENTSLSTHSEPYLFVSHMSAYHPRYVSKMSVSEQKSRVLAAEESASKKLNELSTTLRLKGAEQLAKQRFTERVAKIKDSVKPDMVGLAQPYTHTTCESPISLSPKTLQLTIESQPKSEQQQSTESTPRVLHNPIGKRNVVRGSNEPKLKKLNDNRKLATSRATPTSYESQFATKTQSLFIRDLTTERLKLSKSRGNQKKTEDSILSEFQHQCLDEILQVPVLFARGHAHATTATTGNNEEEKQRRNDTMDPVTKAIMAVKNHNLSGLEEVLDSEGDIDIDTRDQHGNTLFILACQQGSKKLAKILLRRGAYMNAQNHSGNTALHYLNEYNHTNLTEWLMRKGVDDTLRNNEGLTAYEGCKEGMLQMQP